MAETRKFVLALLRAGTNRRAALPPSLLQKSGMKELEGDARKGPYKALVLLEEYLAAHQHMTRNTLIERINELVMLGGPDDVTRSHIMDILKKPASKQTWKARLLSPSRESGEREVRLDRLVNVLASDYPAYVATKDDADETHDVMLLALENKYPLFAATLGTRTLALGFDGGPITVLSDFLTKSVRWDVNALRMLLVAIPNTPLMQGFVVKFYVLDSPATQLEAAQVLDEHFGIARLAFDTYNVIGTGNVPLVAYLLDAGWTTLERVDALREAQSNADMFKLLIDRGVIDAALLRENFFYSQNPIVMRAALASGLVDTDGYLLSRTVAYYYYESALELLNAYEYPRNIIADIINTNWDHSYSNPSTAQWPVVRALVARLGDDFITGVNGASMIHALVYNSSISLETFLMEIVAHPFFVHYATQPKADDDFMSKRKKFNLVTKNYAIINAMRAKKMLPKFVLYTTLNHNESETSIIESLNNLPTEESVVEVVTLWLNNYGSNQKDATLIALMKNVPGRTTELIIMYALTHNRQDVLRAAVQGGHTTVDTLVRLASDEAPNMLPFIASLGMVVSDSTIVAIESMTFMEAVAALRSASVATFVSQQGLNHLQSLIGHLVADEDLEVAPADQAALLELQVAALEKMTSMVREQVKRRRID
jgi:hypothetical protein